MDWRVPDEGKPPLIYIGMKIASLALYFFLLLTGLLILITLPWFWKIYSLLEWVLIANVLLLVFTFGFLVDLSHYHYFATGYTGLFILSVNALRRIRSGVYKLK